MSLRRLTKHHLQEALSVNAPPTIGPQELARATTHPVIPWYFPLSFKETTSETKKEKKKNFSNKVYLDRRSQLYSLIIIANVNIPPPPKPCIARNIINCIMDLQADQQRRHLSLIGPTWARAQAREPIRNMNKQPKRVNFRPKMSDNLP